MQLDCSVDSVFERLVMAAFADGTFAVAPAPDEATTVEATSFEATPSETTPFETTPFEVFEAEAVLGQPVEVAWAGRHALWNAPAPDRPSGAAWRALGDGAPASDGPASDGPARPADRAWQDWAAPGVGSDERTASDRPSAGVQQVQDAVTGLLDTPPTGSCADTAALFALSEQLRGLALRELAELEATGSHQNAGAGSAGAGSAVTAATWLRDQRRVSDVAARAEVRLASVLCDELPAVGGLLRQGRITLEHARAAVAGTRGLDARIVQDSDQAICGLLQTTDPPTVRAHLRERAEALNPELGREAERRAHARRGLTADQTSNGLLLGGTLGVEDGEVLLLGLDLAVRSDRTDGDDRSLRQRRADVLVQWARQAAATHGAPGGSTAEDLRTTRSQLLLTCTTDQLAAAARLAWLGGKRPDPTSPPADGAFGFGSPTPTGGACGLGSPTPTGACGLGSRVPAGASFGPGLLVSTGVLRRLVCDATISLLVTPDQQPAPPDSHIDGNPLGIRPDLRTDDPLYVGRAARIVTAAQWRALVARDRHCVIQGCRRRPLQCEAHHVRHWLDGGTTDLDNLVNSECIPPPTPAVAPAGAGSVRRVHRRGRRSADEHLSHPFHCLAAERRTRRRNCSPAQRKWAWAAFVTGVSHRARDPRGEVLVDAQLIRPQ